MSIENILKKQMDKSNGEARMLEVPQSRKPTSKSLLNLERDVAAQTNNVFLAMKIESKLSQKIIK